MLRKTFLIFVINFVARCIDEYETLCFEILGSSGKLVSLKKNMEIKFIPNTLKIMITMEAYDSIGFKSTGSIFIQKLERTCEESLTIPDFWDNNTHSTYLKVEIFWKEYKIEIFEIEFKTRMPFDSPIRDVYGLKDILLISFTFLKNEHNFTQYIPSNIKWTKLLNEIYFSRDMCIRVMKISGDYFLNINLNPYDTFAHIVDKFYTLKIIPLDDAPRNKVSQEEYIAEIQQCAKSTSYSKMKFFVGDTIREIEIHITSEGSGRNFKMKFSKIKERFVSESSPGYDSNLLDVYIHIGNIFRSVNDPLRESFIVIHKRTEIRECSFKNDNNRKMYNHFVKYYGNSYFDNFYIRIYNYYHQYYYYRKPTEEEMNNCPI